jgi:hypothetical protein
MIKTLSDIFNKLKLGIHNFWRYRKVIWEDRDWDYYFLLELVETKLRFMSEYHRKYGITVNADKYADQMAKAAELIRLLKEENFEDFTSLDEKYGEINLETFERVNVKDKDEYKKDLMNVLKDAGNKRLQVEKELVILLKRYRSWWD